jgi:hypothetical protein
MAAGMEFFQKAVYQIQLRRTRHAASSQTPHDLVYGMGGWVKVLACLG